jgi:hypothetical protein
MYLVLIEKLLPWLGYALVSVAIIAWNLAVYHKGYEDRDIIAKLEKQADQIHIDEINQKVREETLKNSAYAEFIRGPYNEKVDEINRLNGDLHSALSMPTKRKICTSRMPKTGNTEVAGTDETELSKEFREFLESEALRAELEKEKYKLSYDFLMHLCQTGQAVCLKEGS